MSAAQTSRCSSLQHPGFHRQNDCLSSRLSSLAVCATPQQSPMSASLTMAKQQPKIDMPNPFITTRSPICRAADYALIFITAAGGIAAVLAAVLRGL